MTRRLPSGHILIEQEPPAVCEFCQETAETRPYGPGGKRICYQCSKKPEYEQSVAENFLRFMDGEDPK